MKIETSKYETMSVMSRDLYFDQDEHSSIYNYSYLNF